MEISMDNRNNTLRLRWIAGALAAASLCAGAQAGEREDLETLRQTTVGLIQALVDQGFLGRDKAEALLRQAGQKSAATEASAPAAAATTEAGVVRVPYVPEVVRQQIADQVREEVVAQAKAERWGDANAIPEWVDRIKIGGEIRVGAQSDMYGSQNAASANYLIANGVNMNPMDTDRSRTLLRARLGVDAKVSPELSTALRLTTGSSSDSLSTSQTMGNYENKINFALDRAYLRYHDDQRAPWLSVTAGRMPNPWLGTELMWNENLNFDGFALAFDPAVNTNASIRPFGGIGAFPLQDIVTSASNNVRSKWLYGAQGGIEWVRDNSTRARIGLGYYDFENVSGVLNPTSGLTTTNASAPSFRQKGNTLFDITNPPTATSPPTDVFGLASQFRVFDLTAVLDWTINDPVHVITTADYVKNVGFSQSDVLARSGLTEPNQDSGYLLRVAVGMPSMLLRNDWQFSVTYRYLEADAVMDAFNDSDFALGGTNNKGYVLGFQYGLGRGTWLNTRFYSSHEVSGPPLAINTLQVYLNAKF